MNGTHTHARIPLERKAQSVKQTEKKKVQGKRVVEKQRNGWNGNQDDVNSFAKKKTTEREKKIKHHLFPCNSTRKRKKRSKFFFLYTYD